MSLSFITLVSDSFEFKEFRELNLYIVLSKPGRMFRILFRVALMGAVPPLLYELWKNWNLDIMGGNLNFNHES